MLVKNSTMKLFQIIFPKQYPELNKCYSNNNNFNNRNFQN